MEDKLPEIHKIVVYLGEGFDMYHVEKEHETIDNISKIVRNEAILDIRGISAYDIYKKQGDKEWLYKRIEGIPVELTFKKPE